MSKRTHYTIRIYGRNFQINTNEDLKSMYDDVELNKKWGYSDIFSAYDKPSDFKQEIWYDWNGWFIDNFPYKDADWFISGKNCMFFTISGKVRMPDGQAYLLKITYANNYAIRLADE